jgi:hypothetical protein
MTFKENAVERDSEHLEQWNNSQRNCFNDSLTCCSMGYPYLPVCTCHQTTKMFPVYFPTYLKGNGINTPSVCSSCFPNTSLVRSQTQKKNGFLIKCWLHILFNLLSVKRRRRF